MRKTIISFTLMLLNALSVSGQDTLLISQQIEMDSLRQLLDIQEEDSEEKVIMLNEYARLCFYNHEYLNGFKATIEARDMAGRLEFTGGKILYYLTLAVFQGSGEMHTYYQQYARMLSEKDGTEEWYQEIDLPSNYADQNQRQKITDLLPVIEYFRVNKDQEVLGNLLLSISYAYYFTRRYELLGDLIRETKEIFKDLDQLMPVFLSYRNEVMLIRNGHIEGDQNELENELRATVSQFRNMDQLGPVYFQLAQFYRNGGRGDVALDYYLKSAEILESTQNYLLLAIVYGQMSGMYAIFEMHAKSVEFLQKRIEILKEIDAEIQLADYTLISWGLFNIGEFNKAMDYLDLAAGVVDSVEIQLLESIRISMTGQIYMAENQYEEAIKHLVRSYEVNINLNNIYTIPWESMHLATCYYELGEYNTALRYGLITLEHQKLNSGNDPRLTRKINLLLFRIYDALDRHDQAYAYLKKHQQSIDQSNTAVNKANLIMEQEMRNVLEENRIEIGRLEREQLIQEQQNKNQRLWIVSITGAMLSIIFFSVILYRNNKKEQKNNRLLTEQKAEIQSTLEKLKDTQSQLIQSEKMASLGELTAGIAHEIQNPLNFVNNFSDLNSELLEEMIEEIKKGNSTEAIEKAGDVITNEKKIWHHGKRAESIVNNMLQHSRGDAGQKIPTDINNIVDEYVNLAYHGMRARDKSFKADYKTELDKKVPMVHIIPQDIGRVLLNLINNAFYTVDKKAKKSVNGFKPLVLVRTAMAGDKVEIIVKDNGEGIPEQIRDKIFQPFFTNKPTGQGTGLGLSLSYDIIKAHDGEILVSTKDNEGTEFKIILGIDENCFI